MNCHMIRGPKENNNNVEILEVALSQGKLKYSSEEGYHLQEDLVELIWIIHVCSPARTRN